MQIITTTKTNRINWIKLFCFTIQLLSEMDISLTHLLLFVLCLCLLFSYHSILFQIYFIFFKWIIITTRNGKIHLHEQNIRPVFCCLFLFCLRFCLIYCVCYFFHLKIIIYKKVENLLKFYIWIEISE